jgi:hypothetical protein
VCGDHATLSSLLRNQIEIILNIGIFILNHIGVDQTTWRRVLEIPVIILNEEPLVDALVHKNDSDVRLLVCLVVEFVHCLLELRDLCLHNLLSH